MATYDLTGKDSGVMLHQGISMTSAPHLLRGKSDVKPADMTVGEKTITRLTVDGGTREFSLTRTS